MTRSVSDHLTEVDSAKIFAPLQHPLAKSKSAGVRFGHDPVPDPRINCAGA